MAKKVGKNQRVRPFSLTDLTGGINLASAPDKLKENECTKLVNFEFDIEGNKLRTRRGLTRPLCEFPDRICHIYDDYEMNTLIVFTRKEEGFPVVKVEQKAYEYIYGKKPKYLGTLTGPNIPVCCKFDGAVFIASGGKLQRYAQKELETVEESVRCNIVIERFGRLLTTMTGSDDFVYSGIGDYKSWVENPNDLASSRVIEIGYKDGGDIVGIYPLSTDIICFKSNGHIYNVANEPDDWYISMIAKNSDFVGRRAVANLGKDVVYLSLVGLRAVSTSAEYGNFAKKDIGEKANPGIKKRVDRPWISDLRRYKQLIISGASDNEVYVYHYALGAFTTWYFPTEIMGIVETKNYTFVATRNQLCELKRRRYKDYDGVLEEDVKIRQEILSRKLLDTNIMTAYRENIRVKSPAEGHADIKVNDIPIPWDWGKTNQMAEFKTQIRDYELQFGLTTDDPIELDYFTIDVIMSYETMVTEKSNSGLGKRTKKKGRRGGSDPFLENLKKKGKSPYGYR